VLGNGGGNETLRDQARRLRHRGRHGRQQWHWPAQRHPVETSETVWHCSLTERSQFESCPRYHVNGPRTKISRGPFLMWSYESLDLLASLQSVMVDRHG
jgi:hypothetical protein